MLYKILTGKKIKKKEEKSFKSKRSHVKIDFVMKKAISTKIKFWKKNRIKKFLQATIDENFEKNVDNCEQKIRQLLILFFQLLQLLI